MNYALLIYAADDAAPPAEYQKMQHEYGDFTRDIAATGRLGDCAALEGVTTATTVRVRDGKRAITDGPFAETREHLGGYYCFKADSIEDAIAMGAKIPGARIGAIEVREVPPPVGVDIPVGAAPANATKEYLLLIYEDEALWATLGEPETREIYGKYGTFTRAIRESGHFIDGAPLKATRTGKTVRVQGGKPIVTDGPFAETREQLGGYYRIRAAHLDEAIGIAARIPAVETGCIEVRPVMDVSAYV